MRSGSSQWCANECHRGKRVKGSCLCECDPGWTGEACDEAGCSSGVGLNKTQGCSGHGQCDMTTRQCTCDAGWVGVGCETMVCPGQCSGQGTCVDGACLCAKGFSGAD